MFGEAAAASTDRLDRPPTIEAENGTGEARKGASEMEDDEEGNETENEMGVEQRRIPESKLFEKADENNPCSFSV